MFHSVKRIRSQFNEKDPKLVLKNGTTGDLDDFYTRTKLYIVTNYL